jgi:hypothetical protein
MDNSQVPETGIQTSAPPKPLDYAGVMDLWSRIKDNPAIKQQFPDMGAMSRWYGQQTGSPLLAAGEKPSKIKDISVGLDKLLEKTGLPATAGQAVGGLYEKLGLKRESGEQLGQSLPRSFAEVGALLGGAAMMGTPAAPLGAGLMAAGIASPAAKTYEETGSPVAGLITGGLQAALPASGSLGRAALAPVGRALLGKEVLDQGVKQIIPRFTGKGGELMMKAFDYLGGQAGVLGNMEASNVGVNLAIGQSPDFSAEHWAGLGLQMLPTLPFEVKAAIKGPELSPTGQRPFNSFLEQSMAAKNLQNQSVDKAAKAKAVVNRMQTTEASQKTRVEGNASAYDPFDPSQAFDISHAYSSFGDWTRDENSTPSETTMGIKSAQPAQTSPRWKVGDAIAMRNGDMKVTRVEPGETPYYELKNDKGFTLGIPESNLIPEQAAKAIVATASDPVNVPTTVEKMAATMVASNEVKGATGEPAVSDQTLIGKIGEQVDSGAGQGEAAIKASRAILNDAVNSVEKLNWVHEEMKNRGLDPNRTFNDIDLANPSVVDAIKKDPTLTEEQKSQLLKTGSLKPFSKSTKTWQELRGQDEKLQQNISNWLEGTGPKPEEPTTLYRGVPSGTEPKVNEKYTHTSPWGYVASRGGKGAFGDPRAYEVHEAKAQKGHLYYRGGALSESPLESTRIMNAKGMTWNQVLDEGKKLFDSRVTRRLARLQKTNPDFADWSEVDLEQARSDAIRDERNRVIHDIQVASFEADLKNKPGQWASGNLPKKANRPNPVLLTRDEIDTALKNKPLSVIEAVSDGAERDKATMKENAPVLGAPVTLEEAQVHKPKISQKELDRVNVVMEQMLNGQIQWRLDTKKNKWQFTYSDYAAEDLFKAFGTNKDSIANWLRLNRGLLQKIMGDRLAKGGKIEASGDFQPFGSTPELVGIPTQMPLNIPLGASARLFFRDYFLRKGYGAENAEHLAEISQRVGSLFPEIDNIHLAKLTTSEFLQGKLFGIFQHTEQGLIGISDTEAIRGNRPFNQFFKLATFGHEASHGLIRAYNEGKLDPERAQMMRNVIDTVSNYNGIERQTIMNDLFKMVVPKEIQNDPNVKDFINRAVISSSETPAEFVAEYGALMALGLSSPAEFKGTASDLRQYILFSPKHLGEFAAGNFLDMANMAEAVGHYLNVYGGRSNAMAVDVTNMSKAFQRLARTKQEMEQIERQLVKFNNNLEGGMPSFYGQIYAQEVRTRNAFGGKMDETLRDMDAQFIAAAKSPNFGLEPNFYERNFLPAAQFAERFPICKPIIDVAYGFRSLANQFGMNLLRPFMGADKKGKLTLDPEHSGLTRILQDPKLQDAISAVFLEQNARMKEGKVQEPMTPQEISDVASRFGVGKNDADIIVNQFGATMQAMQQARETRLRAGIQRVGVTVAHRFLGVNGLDATSAHYYGTQLSEAMWEKSLATQEGNLVAAQQADLQLQSIAKVVGPEPFQNAVNDATDLHKILATQKTADDAQPFYTPEVRLGRYFVRYTFTDNEKPFVMGYKTRAEMEAQVQKAQGMANVNSDSINVWDAADKRSDSNLLNSNAARAYTQLEKAAFDKAKAISLSRDPELESVFDKLSYQPGEAVYKEMLARGMGKHTLQRSLTPGREQLNMMEGVVSYLNGLGAGLSKNYTKDLAMLHLSDPSMTENPKVRNLMRDYISQVVDPPAKEWGKVKMGIFLSTLGMNFSSIVVERLQPLFSLVPYLTQNGSGIMGSYKYMGKAWGLLSKLKVEQGKMSGIDPELSNALSKAVENKVVDYGIYDELPHQSDLQITNLRNLATNSPNVIKSAASLATKPLAAYASFARNLYTNQASTSSRTAFLASYLLGKDKGMSPDAAYNFATQATRATMHGGGSAARPIGAFNNLGKLYGAASALYCLQHYTTSSIGMLYRMAMDGFSSKRQEGMSSEQISNMKKGFTQMFVTQVAASGAMGLPFLGFAAAGLEQLLPNAQIKANLREGLASLGGDDQETGQAISDAVMNGFATKALGLGAIDVSGRFGLGQMLGVDNTTGFNAAGFFGAGASVLQNFARGIQLASEGKYALGAAAAAPSAFKQLIKMVHNDWDIRDEHGALIYHPSDFEKVASVLGFHPKKMSEIREQTELSQRASDIASRQLRDFHEELSVQLQNGEIPRVRAELLEKHKQDPTYDPAAGLAEVVQMWQDRMTPKVPGQQGSKGSLFQREQIGQTFEQQAPLSATQLYLQRKQMEAKFGLPGTGSPSHRELTQAEMVDRLRQMHPGLSLQHAQAVVEQQMGQTRSMRASPFVPISTEPGVRTGAGGP